MLRARFWSHPLSPVLTYGHGVAADVLVSWPPRPWHTHQTKTGGKVKLKIDTAGVSFTCPRAPEQRVNFDTGQPRVDKGTGLPLWLVQVMALDESGGDVISVTVAGEP